MKTIQAAQLRDAVRACGFKARNEDIIVLDDWLAVVDDDHAAEFFYLAANQAQTILGTWQKEKRDCDKFARFVQTIALTSHGFQSKQNVGLAFAVVAYVSASQGPHAINAMFTAPKGSTVLRLRMFEPQTGAELFLTPKEKSDVMFFLF